MNFADIKKTDTANGKGFGVSLFVSGCRHHCKGCFNPETWNFDYGEEFTLDVKKELLKLLDRPYVDFFSVLGGEPFEPENKNEVLKIVSEVKEKYPNLTINIWSGYLYENLLSDEVSSKILEICDFLIDGEFEQDKYDYKLIMRGSSNQRVINLRTGKALTRKELEDV